MWPRPCARMCFTACCITCSAPNRLTSSIACRSAPFSVGDFGRDQHARVVHHDVDAAEALDGLAERGRDLGRLGDVRRRDQHLGAELPRARGDLGQRLGAARDEHDIATGRGEGERGFAADAARGAGDEHGAIAERQDSGAAWTVPREGPRRRPPDGPPRRPCAARGHARKEAPASRRGPCARIRATSYLRNSATGRYS